MQAAAVGGSTDAEQSHGALKRGSSAVQTANGLARNGMVIHSDLKWGFGDPTLDFHRQTTVHYSHYGQKETAHLSDFDDQVNNEIGNVETVH